MYLLQCCYQIPYADPMLEKPGGGGGGAILAGRTAGLTLRAVEFLNEASVLPPHTAS